MGRVADRQGIAEGTRLQLLEADLDRLEASGVEALRRELNEFKDEMRAAIVEVNSRTAEGLNKNNLRITVMIVTFSFAVLAFGINLAGGSFH